mmetsp:Transcript_13149/g.29935  ORF Transcript_13149/g.29935 Transcript_13149/m.29935 type:complete len:185 (+) Transcript_13149:1-555(+)
MSCQLNAALCCLQLGLWSEAVSACNEVLQRDSGNLKAHYRRAQALLRLRQLKEAQRSLHLLLKLDPENAAARRLLDEVKRRRGVDAQRSKEKVKQVVQAACAEELLSNGRDAERDWHFHDMPSMHSTSYLTQEDRKTMDHRLASDPELRDTLKERARKNALQRTMEEYDMTEEEAREVLERGCL